MRSLCIRSLILAAMAAPLAACGSAPSSDAFSDPGGSADSSVASDGGGTDTSSGGDTTSPVDTGLPPKDTGKPSDTSPPPTDSTPPPIDSGPGITIDNVCERLADVICTPTTQSCCTSKSVAYSTTGCRDGVKAFCDPLVEEVKAGDRTFDASKFDPCAAAWKSLTTTCSVPLLTWVKTYGVCYELLNGSIAPGDGTCSTANDCKAEPGALPSCTDTTGTCADYFIVGKDQPCNYDGGVKHYCDYGFYCPFTGTATKCLPAKGLGSGGCFGTSDPSCGWGNRCDPSGHCAVGLPMGSSCSGDLQCASWSCSSGRCTDPNVEMAIASTCGG